MSDLHPDWHATPEDSASSPNLGGDMVLGTPVAMHVKVHGQSFSRRPAALLGIALAIVIGYTALSGEDQTWSGQVPATNSSSAKSAALPTIRFTVRGAEPSTLTVPPGAQILFRNEQDLPHILVSDDLKDSKGEALYSPALFTGDEFRFQMSANQKPGTYLYSSTTDSTLQGTIIVAGTPTGTTPAATAVSSAPAPTLGGMQVPVTTPVTQAPKPAAPPPASFQIHPPPPPAPTTQPVTQQPSYATQDNLIPDNPFRVGSVPPSKNPVTRQTASFLTTNMPDQQPESGPGLWLVTILSVALLLWMTRAYILPNFRK